MSATAGVEVGGDERGRVRFAGDAYRTPDELVAGPVVLDHPPPGP